MDEFMHQEVFNEFLSEASKIPKSNPLAYIFLIQAFLESKGKTIREISQQGSSRELPVIQKNIPRGGYFVILSANDESTLLQQMFLVMIIILGGESVLINYCLETQKKEYSFYMYLNDHPTISCIYYRLITVLE